ncbi:MAG: TerC/Alx family metal homeostasis membrane protein [Elusimicrobiales bacterium]
MRRAVRNTALWVLSALAFCAGVWFFCGTAKAAAFLTAYIIEYSLSIDNLFVFTVIFAYFRTSPQGQKRALTWGIASAVVMRFAMIAAGVKLLNSFEWMIYVFGALLLYLAVKMMRGECGEGAPEHNPALVFLKKFLPFTGGDGEAFFVREGGVWKATTLFAALVVIEASDLMFAVDSIPAALAVSRDTFIVYSSNIFAVMGLRSLYFLLAGMIGMFCFLKYGIAAVLLFVGVKMLASGFFEIPVAASLLVVASLLAVSVAASVLSNRNAIRKQ